MSVTKAALQGMCPHALYGRYYLAMTDAGHGTDQSPLSKKQCRRIVIGKGEDND